MIGFPLEEESSDDDYWRPVQPARAHAVKFRPCAANSQGAWDAAATQC
jgi:hypothetical protein